MLKKSQLISNNKKNMRKIKYDCKKIYALLSIILLYFFGSWVRVKFLIVYKTKHMVLLNFLYIVDITKFI